MLRSLPSLATTLDDHVRFDERSFFTAIPARLSPAELTALARALVDHREASGLVLGCAIPVRTAPLPTKMQGGPSPTLKAGVFGRGPGEEEIR
jgi:hypothetical protein